jgi:hypothetical protein
MFRRAVNIAPTSALPDPAPEPPTSASTRALALPLVRRRPLRVGRSFGSWYRRSNSRTRWRPPAPVPELDPAKLAVVKPAADPLLKEVQKPAFHGIDLVPHFQSGHAISAALMASAPAAQVKAIGTLSNLQALAFLASVLRHETQALDEGTMDPAQFTAAPAAFFHSPRYNPICVSVQSVGQ